MLVVILLVSENFFTLRHWWIIGLNDLLVTYNDNDILLTTTYHENANLSCYDPITPPIPMAADTLDKAKVECSNDPACTRFYSRCALSPNPPAQKYYKCTTATNVIGSSGCGSKLYEEVAMLHSLCTFLHICPLKSNRVSHNTSMIRLSTRMRVRW